MSSDTSLLSVFRPDVLAMHAYHVQDAAGFIKLDAMENPFTLPDALQAELGQRLGAVALNRYPGVRINDLHTALRAHAGVPADFGLVLGNGSDELISLLSVACAQPGAVALAPLPGFVMYEAFAKQSGLRFVGVPLTRDFELDGPAMLAAIREHKHALTYIAYPNNPTANLWDEAVIGDIIAAVAANGEAGHPGLVVIDEAYQPFASRSYRDRLAAEPQRHAHVLLMRTLSLLLPALLIAAPLLAQAPKTSVASAPPDVKAPPADAVKSSTAPWSNSMSLAGMITLSPSCVRTSSVKAACSSVRWTTWRTTTSSGAASASTSRLDCT